MLAVIVRPWDSASTASLGAPPAPFGVSGFGPARSFAARVGGLARVVFADDTYVGRPDDSGTVSDRGVTFDRPPAAFGAGGFGPSRAGVEALWPAESLPSGEDLANIYFAPRLKSSFNFEVRLFDGDEPTGRARGGVGEMTVLNADGVLDESLGLAWDGRRLEIFEGAKGAAFYPGFVRRFVGTTEGLEWDLRRVTIRLRDPQLRCENVLQQDTFAGSGGLEGDATLTGRRKPLAFGYCGNVACVLIDAANLIYQVHTRQIESVVAVRDKGAPLVASGSDRASYAALAGATIAAGEFDTCLAYGLIRLGAAPAGQVTADIEGDAGVSGIGGDYVNDTAGIVRRIATAFLPAADRFADPDEIDSAAFAALYAQQPAEVGYFADAGETASAALERLMTAIGGAWSVTLLGALSVRRLEAPAGTPAATIAAANVKDLRRRGTVPRWRTRVGYDRMWHVQSKDDLAGSVSEANRARYSEAHRWAEATSAAAREAHIRARDVEVPAFFRLEADAAAEALRQQGLFGSVRHVYRAPLKGVSPFARNLGEHVALAGWDRFGFSDPQSFVLVGLVADVARGELEYAMWA